MGGFSTQRVIVAIAALVIVLAGVYYFSQSDAPKEPVSTDANSAAAHQALMAPGPLPEIVEGRKDAKVTIVEYASMSCPHCAAFHNSVYPKLKEKYIDTGKVRFIFREFPLNNIAIAGAMLSRCVASDRTKDLITELFKRQNDWLVQGNAVDKLFEVVKQAGFTKASFEKCLDDKALYNKLLKVRERADKQFGVNSTPTFFINGKKMTNAPNLAGFDKALEGLVK